MKRLLSLALSAAMLAALTIPTAAAAESADARLTRVTQAVKDALDLNTDGYDTFRGNRSEELVPMWDLNWGSESGSLSVGALEDGTVIRLYRWEDEPGSSGGKFPVFPAAGGDDRAAAEDFLKRVLRPGETAELGKPSGSVGLNSSGASWSGTVKLNGLPSPLIWSIRVEDGMVTSFDRDTPETSYVGGVPSPEAKADPARAAAELRGRLALSLEYVLEDSEGSRAVLRYVPKKGLHEFQVDAVTGELLDLTELNEKLSKGYANSASGAMDTAAAAAEEGAADRKGLTDAEQEGVQKLEGVRSKEELDKSLRAVDAYGLRGYALVSAGYEVLDDGQVLCSLRYARTDGGERLTRTLSVDAKTGEVESVWSSAPWGREKKLSEEDALKKAEAFLKLWRPDRDLVLYEKGAAISPLRAEKQADWSFTFAQEANGLPFRENIVYISIDGADGSVYSLSSNWDEDVSFEDPKGVITPEAALAAWAGTYETVLAYRRVPRKLDKSDPVQARLLERDVDYYYGLRLTYGLEREETYSGVNAKTGEPVRVERESWREREALTYTDLAGSAAKTDIEKLAEYGVGYASEKFRPGKNITQWELAALLYSLRSPALDPENAAEEERDRAYYEAYYRTGALRREDRDDDAVLTRGQVVKLLLDAAGYGPAARLDGGIFTCGYADKGAIPSEELGYAAMAQALDMASGSYAGTRSAVRGEAASMLCRLLERAE